MFGVYFRHKKSMDYLMKCHFKLWTEFLIKNKNIDFIQYVEEHKSNYEFNNHLLRDIKKGLIKKVWIPDISVFNENIMENFLLLCKAKNIDFYINDKIADIDLLYDNLIIKTVF